MLTHSRCSNHFMKFVRRSYALELFSLQNDLSRINVRCRVIKSKKIILKIFLRRRKSGLIASLLIFRFQNNLQQGESMRNLINHHILATAAVLFKAYNPFQSSTLPSKRTESKFFLNTV